MTAWRRHGKRYFDGGRSDTLNGGSGNDTYVFHKGDGQDVISNYDTASDRVDTVMFADVASTELRGLRRSGTDLILEYGTEDSVRLQNHYVTSNAAYYRLNQFTFSDGVTMDQAQLFEVQTRIRRSLVETKTTRFSHAGNDTIDGGAGADTMIGGGGNDTYIVDNAGDVVHEKMNAGIDTVKAL